MVDHKQLATLIARDIFAALDNGKDRCQRLQGKGGNYPAETDLGGFCEVALVDLITTSLAENRSY